MKRIVSTLRRECKQCGVLMEERFTTEVEDEKFLVDVLSKETSKRCPVCKENKVKRTVSVTNAATAAS